MIVKAHCTESFTIVPNSILRERNLSLQAMGLCAYILSLPKQWRINIESLATSLDISKNTAYKYLKELIEAGVLKKARVKDEGGRFTQEAIYLIGQAEDLDLGHKSSHAPVDYPCALNMSAESTQKSAGVLPTSQAQDNIHPSPTLTKEASALTKNKDLSTYQNLVSGKPLENRANTLKCGTLSTYQNLNAINKDSKDKKRESKSARKNQFYILQSLEQKRLFSLCFAKEPKAKTLDLSALSPAEQEAFTRFIHYRKQKHRLTLATQAAILERFLKAKRAGASAQDMANAVEKSIVQGWQGIFIKSQSKQVQGIRQGVKAQNDEILTLLLEQYPSVDFSNIESFLQAHSIAGKKAKYENGLFAWESTSKEA